ncbi:MAG: PEP-CTERM/exosortase system-associated acyltransferase [Colwellia sp.]|nr:PEP-CTERM/exosortase system-associated acyltransferase [Colwellia sp.]
MSSFSIAENFSQYFSIKFANTKELRQEAFKIRYGVYSEELGWESENEQKMESDEYDFCSYHCLLEHKRTKTFAGCIRLVIPPTNKPSMPLPFEANCLDSIRKDVFPSPLFRGGFGEISRLAVLSSFRRREDEKKTPFVLKDINPDTVYSEEERRNFPNIATGLYLAGMALADLCNHQGIFVMMEPRLNRCLRRFGLPFIQVGDETNYHGNRAMFYLEKEAFFTELTEDMISFYNIIYQDLKSQLFLLPHTNPIDS